MRPDSNASVIDRIIDWLRGLFAAGKGAADTAARDVRGSTRQTADTLRDRPGDADRHGARPATGRDRQDLPDLADEPAGGGKSGFGTAAQDAPLDDQVDQRSDFDDAAGEIAAGDEAYPPAGGDLDSATQLHDAVGGEAENDDEFTDDTIDTTRDADLRPGGTEGFQGRDIPLQDQLIVDDGASSDEFDGDEITPGDAENPYVSTADVKSAAEGYGDTDDTSLDNTSAEGTSSLTGSTFTETDVVVPPAGPETGEPVPTADTQDDTETLDDPGSFQVVERYNYGVGDLGVGAGTTPGDAWEDDAGPDVSTAEIDTGVDADIDATRRPSESAAGTDAVDDAATTGIDASVSPEATRTDIESQSRGDAVNRSDEATQTPGFGEPETFATAAAGTTEPSRSATGDDVDDSQDALGTTLDYADESDAVSEEAGDLSGEDELSVSDENVDFGSDRVATFQSGTIAQQGGLASDDVVIEEDTTAAAYADLPDEPEPPTADDAGEDDLAGSDYPSDRVVDTLAGDDFTDAGTPDVLDLDSSAGDLDDVTTDLSAPADSVTAPVERTVGDAGSRLDQDLLADTDQTVGEDVSPLETSASLEIEETGAADAASGVAAGESAPPRSVPGDGGTEAPEGYPVKGKASSRIYHLPEFPSYEGTKAEQYFATEDDAIAAGYRAPGNVRRDGGAADTSATAAAEAVAGDTGALTGDETSHMATGEIAFDERLSEDRTAAGGETPESGAAEPSADQATDADAPAGAVQGDGGTEPPAGYPVKGNASSMIYHLPSFPSYASTKAEFYFASEEDAINAGYRAPGKRNRGKRH